MPAPSLGAAPGQIYILSRDPDVIATACDAARRARRTAAVIGSGQEAISILTAPGRHRHQVVCDHAGPEADGWSALVAAAAEQDGPARLLVVSNAPIGGLPQGMTALPADSRLLASAFHAVDAAEPRLEIEAACLRTALHEGQIEVRYQPIVRIADRKPVMVEALARWPARYPPVAPTIFLPLAARSGLMRALSQAVARAAAQEVGSLRRGLPVGLTVNLPLDVLEQPDLAQWMKQALAPTALDPGDLAIELTEDAVVRDRSAFARLVRRLRYAGHGIFLDDIKLDDPRAALYDCELLGLKLDRSLIAALPGSARARHLLRGLVRHAARRGQILIAEGIADPNELRLLTEIGVDWAQGFVISRPLPATALVAWSRLWRAGRGL